MGLPQREARVWTLDSEAIVWYPDWEIRRKSDGPAPEAQAEARLSSRVGGTLSIPHFCAVGQIGTAWFCTRETLGDRGAAGIGACVPMVSALAAPDHPVEPRIHFGFSSCGVSKICTGR